MSNDHPTIIGPVARRRTLGFLVPPLISALLLLRLALTDSQVTQFDGLSIFAAIFAVVAGIVTVFVVSQYPGDLPSPPGNVRHRASVLRRASVGFLSAILGIALLVLSLQRVRDGADRLH